MNGKQSRHVLKKLLKLYFLACSGLGEWETVLPRAQEEFTEAIFSHVFRSGEQ